jgi:hypothetical protein
LISKGIFLNTLLAKVYSPIFALKSQCGKPWVRRRQRASKHSLQKSFFFTNLSASWLNTDADIDDTDRGAPLKKRARQGCQGPMKSNRDGKEPSTCIHI